MNAKKARLQVQKKDKFNGGVVVTTIVTTIGI